MMTAKALLGLIIKILKIANEIAKLEKPAFKDAANIILKISDELLKELKNHNKMIENEKKRQDFIRACENRDIDSLRRLLFS